jgi:hypothetical protein
MSAYYVIAIVIAVGAVALSAIGLTREDFPPTARAARAVMGGTLVLVLAGIVALLLTTDTEHPREEAAEAREKAAEEQGEGAVQGEGGGATVRTVEDEFSIKLESGDTLKPARYRFVVANRGEIEHDLEIEGEGVEVKTPLIDPGNEVDLEADLKPGKYRFYCTVPGHAQSGMEVEVDVK